MRPYQSSNIVSINGLILLSLCVIVGGIIVGVAASFITSDTYLVFIVPVALGFVAGGIVVLGIWVAKIRNPFAAIGFGIGVGLIIYLTLNYTDYLRFRQEISSEIATQVEQELGRSDADTLNQVVDSWLEANTGFSGFPGYIFLSAQEGVIFSSTSGQGGETNLGSFLTWIYWLAEIVIICALAAFMGNKQANEPFCETHERWYTSSRPIGRVSASHTEQFLIFIRQGNFEQAGAMIVPFVAAPCLEVRLKSCPDCLVSDTRFTLRAIQSEGRTYKSSTLLEGMIPIAAYADLKRGLNSKPIQPH